jgi:vacuolar-type H+-ATPase subunit E/Vma4
LGLARTSILAPAVGALLCLAAGCGDSVAASDPPRERAERSSPEVGSALAEAARARREALEESLRQALAELRPRLEELRERARSETAEGRLALQRLLSELETTEGAAARTLERLRSEAGDGWERLAADAREELERLRKACREAWSTPKED